MNIKRCIDAFVKLGKKIQKNRDNFKLKNSNTWYTENNIDYALNDIESLLSKDNLEKWISQYPELQNKKKSVAVAVITAGNIPFVGFHDLISVLISGNIFIGKLSSKDDKLLPMIINLLIETEAEFKNYIKIQEDKLTDFDAVIATGSNNSARYFEYYFGKYPHIIRKNRNSVALISGAETDDELELLSNDIFIYFGLGCRNVSKLFLPKNYNFENIFKNMGKYKNIINHNKYSNNYGYNRSIYLMNTVSFWDNGFMLLKEDQGYASPVSVIYFEYYSDIDNIRQRLETDRDKIQCVVSRPGIINNSVYFGETQKPKLWDYADNVDTLEFLLTQV